MRYILAVLAVAALAACGSDPVGPDVELDLTRRGGCGDVVFYAVDRDDEVLLTFQAAGLVAEAVARQEPVEVTFDLSGAGASLVLEQGQRVSDATCDDVIENSGPRVDRTWTAEAGRATVTIRPDPGSGQGRGDLVLEDVVLRSAGESPIVIERMEWSDTPVGWFAG